jgi:hydrogenase expression/formation protein HypC
MCLGIPGQVVGFSEESDHLALVEVQGVPRNINIGIVREEGVDLGSWVLIHMGFAMQVIDAEGADRAMDGLKLMGRDPDG